MSEQQQKKQWQERINYIADKYSDGKPVLVGQMVNYSAGLTQAKDIPEMISQARSLLEIEKQQIEELLAMDEPFELKEMTIEQWEAKDDNIDYWEIERIQRLLKRPTIRERFKAEIADRILEYRYDEEAGSGDIADCIIDDLISMPNE